MPLFNVAVREHTYTGRFYHDAVQAESCEEALRVAAGRAAAARPVPGATPQGFSVVVREQAYAGRVYNDTVEAASCEEALQAASAQAAAQAAAAQAGAGQAAVGQQAAAQAAGGQAAAAQQAAAQAAAPEPPPGPAAREVAASRPRCGDVWVYGLLQCGLEAGHDPPHVGVAQRYGRSARWVRDDRGIAHAAPDQVRPDQVRPDQVRTAY